MNTHRNSRTEKYTSHKPGSQDWNVRRRESAMTARSWGRDKTVLDTSRVDKRTRNDMTRHLKTVLAMHTRIQPAKRKQTRLEKCCIASFSRYVVSR